MTDFVASGRTRLRYFGATLILAACLAGEASAFCFQGTDVDGALQYLVCLHNEQTKTLNEHADIINSQGAAANRTRDALIEQSGEIESLRQEVRNLRLTLSSLESEIATLRGR